VSDRTPAPDLADDLGERVADWYAETSLLRATDVTPLADGAWFVSTPRWPSSFATNCVVLRRDPGGEQLVRWTEEQLGAAGLAHRYVTAYCDLSEDTRATLVATGYELTALVEMARPLDGSPVGGHEAAQLAERVDLRESGRLHTVLWTDEWMPGIGADEVTQLVERRLDDSAGEALSWVVRDPGASHPVSGDLVASTDLCLRGWTGEVDAVATLTAFRGRGYAEALMSAAIDAAAARGCTHVVLSALVDDWPRGWYARLGFVEVGVAWEALRRPDALTFAASREATS
jgi:ribosomal protein S18 acetylase RimI-like enzyme